MAVAVVETGGDVPHHRRFVTRTVGDGVIGHQRRFVIRTGGDEAHHRRFMLRTGGDKPVEYKIPTPHPPTSRLVLGLWLAIHWIHTIYLRINHAFCDELTKESLFSSF